MPPETVQPTEVPDGATLLDVREDDEWQAGHVPGSVHVPMSALPGRLADVPDADPLYVVCKVGGRSAQVSAWLANQGYPVVNVSGGLLAWQAAGRPLTTDSGAPATVL